MIKQSELLLVTVNQQKRLETDDSGLERDLLGDIPSNSGNHALIISGKS